MTDKFTTWLDSELRNRGWSDRELGRRAGLTGAAISAVKTGVRKPGWDLCAAVADALGKPPLEVFRMAGLLPDESHGENEPALLHLYRQLPPGNQQSALAMLRGLAGQTVQPGPAPADINLPPEPATPDLEDVIELARQMDSYALRQLYDFARWQLTDQGQRRDSDSKRRGQLGDTERRFLAALEKLPTAAARERAVSNLIELYEAGYLHKSENNQTEAGQSPHQGLNQGTLF